DACARCARDGHLGRENVRIGRVDHGALSRCAPRQGPSPGSGASGLREATSLGLCPRRSSPSGMGSHVHRSRARGRSGAGRAIRLTAAITAWEKLAMADGRGMLLVSALLMALPPAGGSRDAVAADGGQTFQACVPKRTRVLRLLDDGKSCRRRETTIEWSVQGPTGPTGPVGPTGATGGGGGGGGPEPGLGKAFATAKQNLQ